MNETSRKQYCLEHSGCIERIASLEREQEESRRDIKEIKSQGSKALIMIITTLATVAIHMGVTILKLL